MTTWQLVLVLLAAPASAIFGCLAGAWVHYCGRTGRSPAPRLPKSWAKVIDQNEPASKEQEQRRPPRVVT